MDERKCNWCNRRTKTNAGITKHLEFCKARKAKKANSAHPSPRHSLIRSPRHAACRPSYMCCQLWTIGPLSPPPSPYVETVMEDIPPITHGGRRVVVKYVWGIEG